MAAAQQTVDNIDTLSGLPKPPTRPVSYAYWKLAREAAAKGRVRLTAVLRLAEKKRKLEEVADEQREAEIEELARATWKKVCIDITGMRKAWDAKNKEATHRAQQDDIVKEFVTQKLQRTGIKDDFIERSSLYESFKIFHPKEQCKNTALGKAAWFDQLKICLGLRGYHDHPRVGDGRRPRNVWFEWKLLT